jgi:hypothetical protein
MSPFERRFANALPPRVRLWYVMRLVRRLVRHTYSGSRAIVRWRRGGVGAVDLRGSLFCQVREPVAQPLCAFYATAIEKLTVLFHLDVNVQTDGCRGAGGPKCLIALAFKKEARAS